MGIRVCIQLGMYFFELTGKVDIIKETLLGIRLMNIKDYFWNKLFLQNIIIIVSCIIEKLVIHSCST